MFFPPSSLSLFPLFIYGTLLREWTENNRCCFISFHGIQIRKQLKETSKKDGKTEKFTVTKLVRKEKKIGRKYKRHRYISTKSKHEEKNKSNRVKRGLIKLTNI